MRSPLLSWNTVRGSPFRVAGCARPPSHSLSSSGWKIAPSHYLAMQLDHVWLDGKQ